MTKFCPECSTTVAVYHEGKCSQKVIDEQLVSLRPCKTCSTVSVLIYHGNGTRCPKER